MIKGKLDIKLSMPFWLYDYKSSAIKGGFGVIIMPWNNQDI